MNRKEYGRKGEPETVTSAGPWSALSSLYANRQKSASELGIENSSRK